MKVFDILGPVMVGPSSSHTAGAVKIGYAARRMLGSRPVKADIGLHGSFASTGRGHGTDRALLGGLLGMLPDDMQIPNSFEKAEEQGLLYKINQIEMQDAHPNTVLLKVTGENGRILEIQASSLGGSRIMLDRLDGIKVACTLEAPTLIVCNQDRSGLVANVTAIISQYNINIAALQVYREKRGGHAVMVLEMDQRVNEEVIRHLESLAGIFRVAYMNMEDA